MDSQGSGLQGWMLLGLPPALIACGGLLGWASRGVRARRAEGRLQLQGADTCARLEQELARARARERELAETAKGMERDAQEARDTQRGEKARLGAVIAGLERQAVEARLAFDESRTDLQACTRLSDDLRRAVQFREDAIRAVETRMAGLERERAAALASLEEARNRELILRAALETQVSKHERHSGDAGRVTDLEERLAEAQGEMARLRTQLGESREVERVLRRHWADAESALRESSARGDARTSEEGAARARLQARLAELEPLSMRVRELERELAESERRRQAAARDLGEEIRRLREQLGGAAHVAAHAVLPRSATTDPRDDLKVIPGIGPVIARLLARHGITSYRQIAQWTDQDIERIADLLGSFSSRIYRDRWRDGAREAHRRKYGEELPAGATAPGSD
ncbi:MAG TPA: hypothetical protein PKA50_07475 [Gemmatimonadales bacterium]|nr:hypothetical protein [Gemmatimonadales bacterium]